MELRDNSRTRWLFELPEKGEHIFQLPKGIEFIADIRPDCRFNVNNLADRVAIYFWWMNEIYVDYPGMDWIIAKEEQRFLESISVDQWLGLYIHALHEYLKGDGYYCKSAELAIVESQVDNEEFDCVLVNNPVIKLVHSCRPDLKNHFNIEDESGQIGLLLWWQSQGKQRYPRLTFSTSAVFKTLETIIDHEDGLILPYFIKLLMRIRPDLREAFKNNGKLNLFLIYNWWLSHGNSEYPFFRWNIEPLIEQFVTEAVCLNMKLPNILKWVLDSRPDVHLAFMQADSFDVKSYISWWNTNGIKEYPLQQHLKIYFELTDENQVVLKNQARSGSQCGVNVVGFPQGVLGIGEDARVAALCISNIPYYNSVLINAPIPGPEKLVEISDKTPLVEFPTYPTTLYCLPPTEMIRLALEGGKELIEHNDYKIGAWPWELPEWPYSLRKIRDLVDEIWAQSEYVKACFAKNSSVPVYNVPMAVTLPNPTKNIREELGLPIDKFLFYLMFDGNSWLSRKNPLGGVQAFKRAFSDMDEFQGVGLVIKAMNIRNEDPIWKEVEKIAASDDRIHIITDTLSRQDVVNFMYSCDSYISLHRSEGFGRVIAESMLLGKPVVVSNYSGNVDFCKESTSYLVNGSLTPLSNSEYLFSEGQYWFEPDLKEAANQLVIVVANKEQRTQIAEQGRRFIEENYSTDAVSKAYDAQLKRISGRGLP